MESIKLTNRIRDRIRSTLLEEHFRERRRKLKEGFGQLALDVYAKSFDENVVKRMYDLPSGWLPETRKLKAEISGSVEELEFPEGVAKRLPSEKLDRWEGCAVLLKISPREPLGKRHYDLTNEKALIRSETDQLRSEINAVLNSVTTTKRLVEEWPEVESVVRRCMDLPDVKKLPAVRIDQLTVKLGLGTEAVSA